jgi:hypothetical protein
MCFSEWILQGLPLTNYEEHLLFENTQYPADETQAGGLENIHRENCGIGNLRLLSLRCRKRCYIKRIALNLRGLLSSLIPRTFYGSPLEESPLTIHYDI